jgi:adhesin transport system outer membrane protein
MGVQIATEARMDQRAKFDVNPIPPEDRQENSFPYPRMGPPAPGEDPSPPPTGSN